MSLFISIRADQKARCVFGLNCLVFDLRPRRANTGSKLTRLHRKILKSTSLVRAKFIRRLIPVDTRRRSCQSAASLLPTSFDPPKQRHFPIRIAPSHFRFLHTFTYSVHTPSIVHLSRQLPFTKPAAKDFSSLWPPEHISPPSPSSLV